MPWRVLPVPDKAFTFIDTVPETQQPSTEDTHEPFLEIVTNDMVNSDTEDDHLPLHVVIQKETKVLEAVTEPTLVMPKGLDCICIGLQVACDFDPKIGIFHGNIVSVDMKKRRHRFHVVYDDGDEEDYDFAELEYAVQL
jgi:hypothetical protein